MSHYAHHEAGPPVRSQRLQRTPYPFSALVGQDEMKLALLLNAVAPQIAGVLVRGEKGTAKSTAVRALQALLPEITVVQHCAFGCDPVDRMHLCQSCMQRLEQEEELPGQQRPLRLIELPLGATEDRVLGTLDLERAIKDGIRQFEPGLLADAHRGILYIDEVNLLPDHLVDALLDAATTGINVVEREGISFVHPARFLLIGTMNPEEGDLRPQLLDRFGLSVEVHGLKDPVERTLVVKRRIAFEANPVAFYEHWQPQEIAIRTQIEMARRLLGQVTMSDALLGLIAHICVQLNVEGLRADITIYKAAIALAALEGRIVVTEQDIRHAATLALPHRLSRQPFEQPGLDQQALDNLMNEYRPPESEEAPGASSDAPATAGSTNDGLPTPQAPAMPERPERSSDASEKTTQTGPGQTEQIIAPGAPTALATLEWKRPRSAEQARQKPDVSPLRKAALVGLTLAHTMARGRVIGARRPVGRPVALALAPTLRVAALYQKQRRAERAGGCRLLVERRDLLEPIRQQKRGALILFAVDASGSMAARQRMATAKSAVLALLQQAYQERDHVGLLQFRGTTSTLLLPPTNSTSRAFQALAHLPTGGRTPLASGLRLALRTIQVSKVRDGLQQAIVVLVTDGRANVADATIVRNTAINPWEDALAAARELRLAGVSALVIDTEEGATRIGLARTLADELEATYVELAALETAPLAGIIRSALGRTV